MATVIYINDNNLLINQGDNSSISQGYAWLKANQVYFDTDKQNIPVRHSHLFPQQINNHYWQQCDQNPVAKNESGVRNAADLIWKHLIELKKQHSLSEVIFSVPSHYQTVNLQLLLGIAKACDLNVAGLINNAMLSLKDHVSTDGQYLHIDMQLHQAVCSTVSVENGRLLFDEAEVVHETGLLLMQDAMLKAVRDNFIKNDRFDPLHHAHTEQQLFDQLPDMINKVVQFGKTSISVDYQSQQHTANIESKQLISALKPFYEILLKASKQKTFQHIYYAANGVDPIGLESLFKQTLSVVEGPEIHAQELIELIQADSAEGGDVTYLTQCSLPGSSTKKTTAKNKKSRKAVNGSVDSLGIDGVTHLLQSGVAVSLDKAFIDTSKSDLHLVSKKSNVKELLEKGTIFIVNDDKRKTLQPNDRLASNLADGVISAIKVQNDG